MARSRWFEYYRASPLSRSPASRQSAECGYLLRAIRDDLDEPRRWQAIDRLGRRLLAAEYVNHNGAVPVLDAEIDRPPFFVVEPFFSGCSLDVGSRQNNEIRDNLFTVSKSLWILRQVAEIISAAHDSDRVHLGVLPEHVIVGDDGKVTISGWCNSHQFGQRTWLAAETVEDVWHLAPEACCDQYRASGEVDVYGIGMLAHWLFTGRGPFPSADIESTLAAHRRQIPVDLQLVQPLCPSQLSQIVNLALAKNPQRRPSIKSLVDALISIEIEHLHNQQVVLSPTIRPIVSG